MKQFSHTERGLTVNYQAQDLVAGFMLNPVLPEGFDDTPNDDRPFDQIALYWDRPFILSDTWEERGESYDSYLERARRWGFEATETREGWDQHQAEFRRSWFEKYPEGVRYTVRCLDGGAWDRSTWWGDAATLEAALVICRGGPNWRRLGRDGS